MDDFTHVPDARRVHFIGIGGSGMTPLAEILHGEGYAVTGSDESVSDNTRRLSGLGIPVFHGHDAARLDGAELVVYTAAIRPGNPELDAARASGVPLLERAKLLGLLSRRYARTVAVAGTHGKTTATSMLAQILVSGGFDPSVVVGGRLPLIDANGRAGKSDLFLCEACEFKDHYLEMRPALSIILNVDADHLDYFGSLDGVKASFRQFAGLTADALIVNADDANTMDVVASLGGGYAPDVIRCGTGTDADVRARDVRLERGAWGAYTLEVYGERLGEIRLGAPGAHNVGNSLCVAAAALRCGADFAQIAAGLAAFRGAGRRFEFLGEARGVTVADDYAHHPTEIAATLAAAQAMGYARVWAVFQPFTFTRTARHLPEFAAALAAADVAVVCDILGSRETNDTGVTAADIAARIPGGVYAPAFGDVAAHVLARVQPGDLILTMGGGDVYKCARMMLAALQE